MITYNGITDSQAGWARRCGITKQAMSLRLKRMSLENALSMSKHCQDRSDYADKIDDLGYFISANIDEIRNGLFSAEELKRLAAVKQRNLK
jgi:hypothetical protein